MSQSHSENHPDGANPVPGRPDARGRPDAPGQPEPTSPISWPVLSPGKPISTGPLTVFPIEGIPGQVPDYLLLADAMRQKLVEITEVDQQGHVPILLLTNRSEKPVLAIQGEELIGAKQNRTLNVSILVATGKTEIPVTCIEQGRWHYSSPRFDSGGFEHYELRAAKAQMVSESRKRIPRSDAQGFMANQAAVWEEVDREISYFSVHSPTSSLSDVYADRRVSAMLDRFDTGLQLPETTKGVVIGLGRRLVAAELCEHPEMFAQLWPRILRSYALTSVNELALHQLQEDDDPGAPTLQQAEAFLLEPCSVEVEVGDSVGLGKDVRWEGDAFLACSLFHEGRMLHGTVYARS